ncbi:MAG: hypothetical protein HYV07_02275 [Deltaproteobacteria bacterium]|nr:hypothetical protein [Deltaproteobacteria bacterium]
MTADETDRGLLAVARRLRNLGEPADRIVLALCLRLSEALWEARSRGRSFLGFQPSEVMLDGDGRVILTRIGVHSTEVSQDLASFEALHDTLAEAAGASDSALHQERAQAIRGASSGSFAELVSTLEAQAARLGFDVSLDASRGLAERTLPFDPQFAATMRLPRRREAPPAPAQARPADDAWTGGSIRIPVPAAPPTSPEVDEPGRLGAERSAPSTSADSGAPRRVLGVIPRVVSRSSTPTARMEPRTGYVWLWLIGIGALVGVLVAAFFFREHRPLEVLLRMRPAQEAWFRAETLARFERETRRQVSVRDYRDETDVVAELSGSAAVDVVKVESVMLRPLVELGLLTVLDRPSSGQRSVALSETLARDMDPVALALGTVPDLVGKRTFGAPRKLETHLLLFRRSRVQEAAELAEGMLPELQAELERLAGARLPAGYALEPDPSSWDVFDVLVAGFVWSRSSERGTKAPRVMLRSYPYVGTVVRLLDAVAGSTVDGAPELAASTSMIDVLEWEALFRELGIYHPRMTDRDAIVSGREIVEAFGRGEVFLTETHTLDARLLWTSEGSDVGVSVLPRRVSLALDNTGTPLRVGTRRAHVRGWVWAIPKNAPEPDASRALISHLVSANESTEETRAFWIQPARRDVVMPTEISDVVAAQMRENGGLSLPSFASVESYERFRDKLVGAWWEIIAERNYLAGGMISRTKIKRILEDRFAR